MLAWKPRGNVVVILPDVPKEDKVASGIVIPESYARNLATGTVVAVGPGFTQNGKKVPIDIFPGDTVLYNSDVSKQDLHDFEEGVRYILIDANSVLMVKKQTTTKAERNDNG